MISKSPVNFVTPIFNVVLIVSTVYSLDLNNTATTTTTSTPTATTTEYSVTETILIASSLNSSSVDHDDFDEISNNFKGDQFNNTDGNSTATTTIINNATLTPTPAPTQAEPVKGTEEYLDYLWTKLLKCGYDTCFNCFKQECNWCTSKAENCMKLAGETIWPILISTLKEDELPDIIDPPAPIKSKVSTVKVNETTSSTTPMSTATPASTSTLTPTSNPVNGSTKPDIVTIITTTIVP